MIFFLIYLAVAVLFVLPTARFVLDEMSFGEPEVFDYAMATFLGFLIANFWPLILLGIPFVRALRKPEPADDKDAFTQ